MKVIKINDIEWQLEIDDRMSDDICGTTEYFEPKISINSKMKGIENIKRTVMHEVIHAYLYSYGFTNKEKFELEQMIEFISHNFYSIEKLSNEAYQKLYMEGLK